MEGAKDCVCGRKVKICALLIMGRNCSENEEEEESVAKVTRD
jgi:hypothetical protein